jgi:molybdopterin-containing oxidoreductase family iron-sulfur binding subunit
LTTEHLPDELEKLGKKPEVFAPSGDFEESSGEVEASPYYAAAEEVMPELEASDVHYAGSKASSIGKAFPVDRRDFMRLFSLGAVAASAACVRRPPEAVIPYVSQPIDSVPGVATHYATTCGACPAACGVMVKTREGRPVKLEGISDHPINQGALCGLGQASIQGLFHPERLTAPLLRQEWTYTPVSWDRVFAVLKERLKDKKRLGIFTGGSTGHRQQFFREALQQLGADESLLYTWEANGLFAAQAKAHELAFGIAQIPRVEFHQAKFVVGIGSDVHELGVSPVAQAKGMSQSLSYADGTMGTFVQFEANMTLSGAAADERIVIAPGSELAVAILLVKQLFDHPLARGSAEERAHVQQALGQQSEVLAKGYEVAGVSPERMKTLADELLNNPSLILAGGSSTFSNDATVLQLFAVMANILIGAYGKSLLLDKGWMPSPVVCGDVERFLKDAPSLDALFIIDSDPLFTLPAASGVRELLKKIPLVVSMQAFPVSSDECAHLILPTHHYLESWGDEQAVAGFWSIRQPAVRPTTGSRQAEDVLLWLLAYLDKSLPYQDYLAYLKSKWQDLHHLMAPTVDFDTFFQAVQRKGYISHLSSQTVGNLKPLAPHTPARPLPGSETLYLVSPLDHRLQDGRGAHLPILQETADGLTTATWDSWAAMNPNTMARLKLTRNQVVKIKAAGGEISVVLYPLPGVHPHLVVVARGNGSQDKRNTIARGVGVNPLGVYPAEFDALSGQPLSSGCEISLSGTSEMHRLATLQKHHDIAGRKEIIKNYSLGEMQNRRNVTLDLDKVPDLFPSLEVAEHRWGMSIDLNKCNGCGACVAACAIENNVPQVGREQILLGREMHWIRLDRYFAADVDRPRITFQPLLCQQCNHAPCEAVCPVFATTHDPEGINAMTYNRCVGTRYCANACPYKVRRFNWWTHAWGTMGERPQDRNPRALNPDVTVRTRGIMEKCNFCVGRLREAKHTAKIEGRPLRDGEVKVACQQTCPSEAIVFGNLNDTNSKVAHERRSSRAYLMLGGDPEHGHYGLKTLPNVNYLAKVHHGEVEASAHHHVEHS